MKNLRYRILVVALVLLMSGCQIGKNLEMHTGIVLNNQGTKELNNQTQELIKTLDSLIARLDANNEIDRVELRKTFAATKTLLEQYVDGKTEEIKK